MKIGFIGLGNMGFPMACRLVEGGYELVVYDTMEHPLNKMAGRGAEPAPSLHALSGQVDLIILMLPDSHAVEAVVLGDNGLSGALKDKTIIIDMSTSTPSVTRRIGETIAHLGSVFMDAPVSGGVRKAEAGSLTIMVGGEAETFATIEPVLRTMGDYIVHTGPLGSGHTIKVLNNLLSATHFLATLEILCAGVNLGLRPENMLSVINTSTGRNLSSEYKIPNFVLNRTFNSDFSMDLMCKDIAIAVSLINEGKTPAFLPGIVSQIWNLANAKGERRERTFDHTEIAKLYEAWLGSELKTCPLK